MEVLTLEQLCKNINNSRNKSSNYYRIARATAYEDVIGYNNHIKKLQQEQQRARANNQVWTNKVIYSKESNKCVTLTIYTKLPRYRSYKQQVAINCATLEITLKNNLEQADYNSIQLKKTQTELEDNIEYAQPCEPTI